MSKIGLHKADCDHSLCRNYWLIGRKIRGFETYTAHGGPVKDFDLSPNAANIASASCDYSIVLWNGHTLSPLSRLIRHDAAVVAVAFSPDERFRVSGGEDCKSIGLGSI